MSVLADRETASVGTWSNYRSPRLSATLIPTVPVSGAGPRDRLIVHHTGGERKFAYDRESAFGKLAKSLGEVDAYGWTVVDVAND